MDDAKIHAGASVSGDADIRGDVTIMTRTVIHPTAVIVADVRSSVCSACLPVSVRPSL